MRSRRVGRVAVMGVLVVVVSGCVSPDVHRAIDRQVNNGLSGDEVDTARHVALARASREHAIVGASVTASKGTVPASKANHHQACTSMRLLHITLRGEFPRTHTAQGEVLTVDARSGAVCGDRFVTEVALPDPNAVSLFSR